jgi:hypothetical protein
MSSEGAKLFQTEVDIGDGGDVPLRKSSTRKVDAPRQGSRKVDKIEDAVVRFRANKYTPLPELVDIDTVMEIVLKSMPFASGKSKLIWRNNFKSDACQKIVLDSFWWFMAHLFQGDQQAVQDQLLARLADNFVRLFYQVPSEHKDQFFGRFYDSLAQIIFQSFYIAYPKSRGSFDDNFKLNLIDTCAEWTTGLVPSRPTWLHWAHEQDMKGSKKRHDLGGLGLGRSGKTDSAAKLGTKLTKWNRAIRTNQSLTYSPLVSQFMANEQHRNALAFKIALTEDPSRPIAPTPAAITRMSRSRRTGAGSNNQTTAPKPAKVVQTRAQIVAITRDRRNEILQHYQAAREDTLREISVLRKDHMDDQVLMEEKRKEVFSGDVHEYSNYLVSIVNAQEDGSHSSKR